LEGKKEEKKAWLLGTCWTEQADLAPGYLWWLVVDSCLTINPSSSPRAHPLERRNPLFYSQPRQFLFHVNASTSPARPPALAQVLLSRHAPPVAMEVLGAVTSSSPPFPFPVQ
jgi:hypothetical protein